MKRGGFGRPPGDHQRHRRIDRPRAGLVRRMWRDRRGLVGVIAAIILPVILGFAALVIDYGYLTTIRNQLQAAAEAASLAGVRELPSTANASNVAREYAAKNMAVAQHGPVLLDADVIPGSWEPPTRVWVANGVPLNAIRAISRRAQNNGNSLPPIFAGILGIGDFDINTAAIATVGGGDGMSCLIALNESAPKSLHVFGTADINAVGCNIQVNSCADTNAMWSHGTSSIVVSGDDDSHGYMNVCGDLRANGPVTLDPWPYDDTEYQEGDPFEEWDPGLRDAACTETGIYQFSGTKTLTPGVYCGGIKGTGSGTVTFMPGEYVIKGGEFSLGANLSATGDEVGFYLTGPDANLKIGGGLDILLSAPTSGPLAGFVFASDKLNPADDAHVMSGGPVGQYQGMLYFPEAAVEIKGNSTAAGDPTSDCLILIADTIYFNGTTGGNMQLDNECSDYSGLDVFTQTIWYALVD